MMVFIYFIFGYFEMSWDLGPEICWMFEKQER